MLEERAFLYHLSKPLNMSSIDELLPSSLSPNFPINLLEEKDYLHIPRTCPQMHYESFQYDVQPHDHKPAQNNNLPYLF